MIEQSAIHVYVKKTHGQPSFRCYYIVEELRAFVLKIGKKTW